MRGHVSLGQLKVMSAIEGCRTAALGGHVMRCENCVRTRRSPTTAAATGIVPSARARRRSQWLEARKAELLAVPYFHVVFTLPPRIAAIAYQNKAVIYDLLFKASAETMLTIAADPKRLGVKIGFTSVLHTWGSAMTHHPHVHMIVPGGGISLDGTRWISSVAGLSLAGAGAVADVPRQDAGDAEGRTRRRPPAVLRRSRPPRRQGRVQGLSRAAAIDTKWHVYAKRPFAGPEQVLAYLVPLHAPRRHLQQPPDRRRRRPASRSGTRTIGSKAPAATRP